MMRFLAGVVTALLLATAGLLIWRAQAQRAESPIPPVPGAISAPFVQADTTEPATATEKTREQKRFTRYDKDKNGLVARDEYLAARQKAFAKLDSNGDGRLAFDEYAVKTIAKFASADRDRNATLTATEFATTLVVRKAKPRCDCGATPRAPAPAEESDPE